MNKSRKLNLDKNYWPIPTNIGDEIYPNGIFHFNISRIIEHITSRELVVEKERIHVNEWFKTHFHGSVNEEQLPTVNIEKPVIQAGQCACPPIL